MTIITIANLNSSWSLFIQLYTNMPCIQPAFSLQLIRSAHSTEHSTEAVDSVSNLAQAGMERVNKEGKHVSRIIH